jgi:hypothetical protein
MSAAWKADFQQSKNKVALFTQQKTMKNILHIYFLFRSNSTTRNFIIPL